MTDSHIKLDILVDTQEPFKNSHHKVALDNDEDTVSFIGTLEVGYIPLKNSGRNAIQYIVSCIRYQYSENLVADEKVYVNLIPFIVTYTS